MAQPVLNSIEDRSGFLRNGGVLLFHKLGNDAGCPMAELFPLALPLPAGALGGDLFFRFRKKMRALALKEQVVVQKSAEYGRLRFRSGLGKKQFGKFRGLHFAMAAA